MTDLCMKPLGGAYRLHFVKYFAHATAREVLLHIFKLLRLLVVNGRWKTKETFFFKNSKGLFSSNFGSKCSKFGPSIPKYKLFHNLLVANVPVVERICLLCILLMDQPVTCIRCSCVSCLIWIRAVAICSCGCEDDIRFRLVPLCPFFLPEQQKKRPRRLIVTRGLGGSI